MIFVVFQFSKNGNVASVGNCGLQVLRLLFCWPSPSLLRSCI